MKVALFDFDGTLFPKETIPYLVHHFPAGIHRKAMVYIKILPALFAYKIQKTLDKEQFRHKAVYAYFSLMDGRDKDWVERYFLEQAQEIYKLLDPEVVRQVHHYKEQGYLTVLLSGCFDLILGELKERLMMDRIICTCVPFIGDIYDVKAQMTIVSGQEKLNQALALEETEHIDWEESVAYADSIYDAPLLDLVGNAVAVNPDEGLEALAKEKGYTIFKTRLNIKK